MTHLEQQLIEFLGPKVFDAASEHAKEQYPKESCGFVAYGKYIACENKAGKPDEDFTIDDKRLDRAITNGKLKAIIHSHPHGPIFPTAHDMRQQVAFDVPWIVLTLNADHGVTNVVGWGDGLPMAPIIGRPFVHGVFDCYSVIRDTFALGKEKIAEQGIGWPYPPIKLAQYPRDDAWWQQGGNLYTDNFAKQGFIEITRSEARPGDAFLMKLGDRRANPNGVLNHAGLLIEKGHILHHLPTRVSRREPAGIWAYSADMWVRYVGASQ
jgi:proteasome lid subunit RPN8/RPN11